MLHNQTFNVFQDIFNAGFIGEVRDFMDMVVELAKTTLNGNLGTWMSFFVGGAVSLLLLYFYIEVSSQASMELLTLEKLVVLFTKLIVGVTILVCLKDIILYMCNIFSTVYELLADNLLKNNTGTNDFLDGSYTFFGTNQHSYLKMPDGYKLTDFEKDIPNVANKDFFEAAYKSIDDALKGSKLMDKAFLIILVALIFVAGLITKIALFLFVISNAVTLLTRAMFSPIAVANLFDGGAKSTGVQYLKKLGASVLTFAVIIGMLFAASALQQSVVLYALGNQTKNIDGPLLITIIGDIKTMAAILVAQFALVGGVSKAGQVANDILGV